MDSSEFARIQWDYTELVYNNAITAAGKRQDFTLIIQVRCERSRMFRTKLPLS